MSSPALRFGGTLLLAAAIPAYAQFSQLTATDDGKQLYFTSQSLLKGATQTTKWPESRLYRYGTDGVTVFAERGTLAPQFGGGSSDGVSNPQVSGDGSIVGFTLHNICPMSSDCTQPVTAEGELRGKITTQDLGPGELQLSRNGRWALLSLTNVDFTANPPTTTQSSQLIDVNTGQRTTVPSGFSVATLPANPTVASDGTLLVKQGNTVGLWKQGQFTPIQFPIGLSFNPIALSDDGGTLFLSGAVPGPGGLAAFRILAMNLASGKFTTVFQQKDSTQLPIFMGASNDGQMVLYRYGVNASPNGPAFVFNTATGATTPISLPAGEFATDGTLTGGGNFAFLATSAGRLVKVTLATGAIDSLFPGLPHCSDLSAAVAGSFVRLQCNVTGSVSDLQGKILVNDVPMAILYVTANEIGAQVPWDVGSLFGVGNLSLKTANDSPFQASQPLNQAEMIPLFERADPGTSPLLGLKLVKSDWSGLLTTQPAPGDIFYAYLTGLGAVNGPMVTGVPAPNTPAPILGSLTCQFAPQSSPAKTLFGGLAPGMVGIYQVAFQVPSDAGAKPITCLSCTWTSLHGGGQLSSICGGM